MSLPFFQVEFPLYGKTARLMPVCVTNYQKNSSTHDWAHTSVNDSQTNMAVNQVLRISREGEAIDHKLLSVGVKFDNRIDAEFNGNSYQLALALADKCARFQPCSSQLLATGEMKNGQKIGCIEGFSEKLALLEQAFTSGHLHKEAIFACPADNIDAKRLSEAEKQQLKRLKAHGLIVRPVQQLEELSDLWGANNRVVNAKKPRSWTPLILVVLALLIGLALQIQPQKPPPPPPINCQAVPLDLQTCINKADFVPVDALQPHYEYRKTSQGSSKSFALQDGAVLAVGDQFSVQFKANLDLYVYLYYLDSEGQLLDLMQLSHTPHALSRGQSLRLPSASDSFTLTGKAGLNRLYLIASKTPQPLLSAQADPSLLLAFLAPYQQRYFQQ